MEEKNINYIEWQKVFVNGRQNTYFNEFRNSIEEYERQYYWQVYEVFNLLKPIVGKWVKDKIIKEEYLWGEGNIVDQLIPYQKHYNDLMNKVMGMCHQLAYPLVLVEDGSVDADELAEEGMVPGKILIYRQNLLEENKPKITPTTKSSDIDCIYNIAENIKEKLIQLAIEFEDIYGE